MTDLPLERQLEQIRALRTRLGPSERATAEAFESAARDLVSLDHEHVPVTSMQRYFATLAGLDLDAGACPLVDTPFNRHKSALEFYEHAVSGTVTLASDVPPYRGEVSLVTGNDAAEWREALEALLLDETLRADHLARQSAFVLEHRDIRSLRARWRDALRSLIGGSRPANGAASFAGAFDGARSRE